MITNRICQWARSQPNRAAITGNDHTLTYRDFVHAIGSAYRFFDQQGLQATQTAIVLPGVLMDAWVFVMALRMLGLDTVCVQSVEDAKTIILKNVACIVGSTANQPMPELAGHLLGALKVIIPPGEIFSTVRTGDALAYPNDLTPFGGHILLTSGTTGTYKQLFLDGDHEDMRNEARANAYRLSKHTTFHAVNYGLWTTVGFRMPSAIWHVGGSVVLDTRPGALSGFFHHPIDLSILIPSMLKELTQTLPPGPPHDDCELLITSGFLPIALAEEASGRVTKKLGVSYGCTELATPAMLPGPGPREDIYWMVPAPNRTIQIVDEQGSECRAGQEGELRIKLMGIDCTSYLHDEEASVRMFRNGFFYPGDMAVRRPDGRIRILGRTADVLNFQGQKVAVAPIELEIQRALRVDEVCLFSGLNRAGKEELVIVIQSNARPPRVELDRIARAFGSFESVRFEVLKEFPRTAIGTRKTQRSVLRNMTLPTA